MTRKRIFGCAIGCAVGFVAGHFIYESLTDSNWREAAKLSFFQINAIFIMTAILLFSSDKET